ncbi:hypothetical protein [Mycolicibacterium sp. CBMA 226]|uniref:hypothetical protein n=1 Tax=Mycolicibacterium sp. CBMA 226 TaxID=2606611 RepID=UPI0012DD6EA3|nr:hypothetical protein [Mycolicibacterium sp. CBMA 226]MUL75410.1 hypothetical protein [Mycolicibacterium sp. CBMA 226]
MSKTLITAASVFWPDYLYDHFGRSIATTLLVAALAMALVVQLCADRLQPLAFWSVMLTASAVGTEIANGLHVTLGLHYAAIAVVCLVGVVGLLALGRATVGMSALVAVTTRRAEGWFWAISLPAFAVGTALTHMTPTPVLPYPVLQVVLWAALIGGVAVACRSFGGMSTVGFWGCFILTRPLGAAAAFLLTNVGGAGGLGLARPAISAALTAILVGSVRYR